MLKWQAMHRPNVRTLQTDVKCEMWVDFAQ